MTDATNATAANATATDEFDEWGGESGFKDNYPGLITDAYFAKDSRYNNGDTLVLILKILADDGEDVEQMYPTGADWDSFDNGETAEHPKDKEGKPRAFNHRSAIFGLMSHAFEAGAEEVLRGRGRPRVASIWRGLKFFWVTHTEKFTITDRATKEPREVTTTRTFPKEFLGVFDVETGTPDGSSSAASSAGSTQSAPTTAGVPTSGASSEAVNDEPLGGADEPAAAANANTNGSGSGAFDLSGFDPAMIAKLKIHAKAKPYTEFLDHAMTVDGVTTNDSLLDLLGQEAFYAHLRG